MTRRRRVLIVLGAVLGGFVLYESLSRVIAYTDDAYVRSDLIAVAPQITGRIVGVHVVDNQVVKAGDLLITIDSVPFELMIAERRQQINEARAQVNVSRDQITMARDAYASAESASNFAHLTQHRIVELATTGVVSRQRLDQVDDELTRAQATLLATKAAIARAEATTEAHQSALARAEAEMATAEWRLARTKIFAPADGIINNLTTRVGDTAQADVPLIGIVDANAWRIVANYKQDYIRQFEIGGIAWVWLDSQPWHLHRARIAGIGRGISREPEPAKLLPYVAPTTDWIRLQRRFPVTLTLIEPPADLKLYMGADARTVIFP
jgi:membrane fusion protein, multidrug efflux system